MSRLFRIAIAIALLVGVLGFSVTSKVSAASSPQSSTFHAAHHQRSDSLGQSQPQQYWLVCLNVYLLWRIALEKYGYNSPQEIEAIYRVIDVGC